MSVSLFIMGLGKPLINVYKPAVPFIEALDTQVAHQYKNQRL